LYPKNSSGDLSCALQMDTIATDKQKNQSLFTMKA
jgi:hypothetical protein